MTDDDTPSGETGLTAQQREELETLTSALVKRNQLGTILGQSFGDVEDRDYYDTLGYPGRTELQIQHFRGQFDRGGIAETIVSAVSGQTWNAPPEITDAGERVDTEQSEFERDVEALFDEKGALNYIERADTLQRIGRYGILLLGLNDGRDLDQPVDQSALTGSVADDVLFLQPFGEDSVNFDRVEDPTDERFALPGMYEVDFGEDGIGTKDVHHSRVIHIAEGALEDEAIGRSAYEPIYNYLIDLTKVVGGSAEMYWRDAKKRFVANLDPDAGPLADEDAVSTQVEEMVNDLRDVVWSRGLDMEAIDGGSPDPSGLKDALLELIAGATRIPKRRLLGTERGDLASTQDEAAFAGMIEERRQKFAEPQVLRSLLDLLIEYGVVATPSDGTYDVEWADLFELTELEEAERKQRLASAFKEAASMGDPAEIATVAERREAILDLPPDRGSLVDGTPNPGGNPTGTPPSDPSQPGGSDPGQPGGSDSTDVSVDEPLDESDADVEEFFDDYFADEEAVADGGHEEGD